MLVDPPKVPFHSGFVALIGHTNSGKSSLMNELIGERVAIVSGLPQTTRQHVRGIYSNTWAQIIFLDTPGLHESEKNLNKVMLQWTDKAVRDADGVCVLIPADNPIIDELITSVPRNKLISIVITKADLVEKKVLHQIMDHIRETLKPIYGDISIVSTSATTGSGIIELRDYLSDNMPLSPPLFPTDLYTDQSVKFMVGELIRRAALDVVHQEIPYSIAVEVEQYEEQEKLHKILATIVVERDSQKGIVIGAGGKIIKKIGIASRIEIERLVGCKVYLELVVKVRENWTKDNNQLKQLGLLPE